MGMFDDITCKYPLPGGRYAGQQWQTKSTPELNLDSYEIREDGSLWHQTYDIEDTSDPNATGWRRLCGMATRVNKRWEPCEMTGEICFYDLVEDDHGNRVWVEFSAYFFKGELREIHQIEGPKAGPETEEDEVSDIVERLRSACVGHPNAKIPWPHRLLHDAIAAIEERDRRIAELEAENAELNAVYRAARGLCHGTDWNNGTHAVRHGYRAKLIKAVSAVSAVAPAQPLPKRSPPRRAVAMDDLRETLARALRKFHNSSCYPSASDGEIRIGCDHVFAAIESAGFKIVPAEPTQTMHEAARDWSAKKYGKPIGSDASDGCYRAMLSASPTMKGQGND